MSNLSHRTILAIGLILALALQKATAEWEAPLYPGYISIFPHLVGIADVIFTGTPVATNGSDSADFIVDEVVWGNVTGTNITVQDFSPYYNPAYHLGEKYLVGAFTNDWWMGKRCAFGPNSELLHFLPATNRPPDGRLLDGYMLVEREQSALPFRLLSDGGTNYWEATRALITNLIDIGRIQCDEAKVRETVISITDDRNNSRKLPSRIRRKLLLYRYLRYDPEGGQNAHVPIQ
jgi:hypothetical protein